MTINEKVKYEKLQYDINIIVQNYDRVTTCFVLLDIKYSQFQFSRKLWDKSYIFMWRQQH